MDEQCTENNVELLHILQILKLESYLKAFYIIFKFDVEKIELPDFWPKSDTVSRFYLNEAARGWLKSGSKLNTKLCSIQTINETKI